MNLSSRNKINPSFNSSSLNDLVFLLLVFFIILSTMITPPSLSVDLPKGSVRTPDPKSVSVTLFKDGTISVGSKKIDISELENELAGKLSVYEDKSILLNADENSVTGDLVAILDIAKRNQWRIALGTEAK